ncbi:MAG TPA: DUF3311 domain-containing protein [Streptosporangiaceae bacterium]|jgi:hypothetical protein
MSDKPPGWSAARVIVVAVLLLLPFVGTLWVSVYARTGPAFIGVPFFYWYQMAWVILSAACTWAAYVLTMRAERARRAWNRAHAAGPAREEGGDR